VASGNRFNSTLDESLAADDADPRCPVAACQDVLPPHAVGEARSRTGDDRAQGADGGERQVGVRPLSAATRSKSGVVSFEVIEAEAGHASVQ
jgi:hypothetical protein